MQALVRGGSDGYCFIEKDANVHPGAESQSSLSGSLLVLHY